MDVNKLWGKLSVIPGAGAHDRAADLLREDKLSEDELVEIIVVAATFPYVVADIVAASKKEG